MSISKAQIKRIRALHQSKFRRQEQLFFVEGKKGVEEAMRSTFQVSEVYTTSPEWAQEHPKAQSISEMEMAQISDLHAPSAYFAVVEMGKEQPFPGKGKWLYLDGIRDPGNLGTMIRSVDWFGWKGIVLSEDCVEWTNPKVIQSTMGSVFNVQLLIASPTFLSSVNRLNEMPIWGACLEGTSLEKNQMGENGILVIGSESHGIRSEALEHLTHRVTIPAKGAAESLNAAIAASIIVYEWS
jgi:RNA methyltransferase, TrmH family